MIRWRSLSLAFVLVLPVLLVAWGSALARPCLMDSSHTGDCCDGITCSPACMIGCQATVTPERPASAVSFAVSAPLRSDASPKLVGIDIAPDGPPPR